ncbi:hypothetical protein B0A55_07025 [Friedmanniomyces simplex]|uniref:Uncharacterized protein n=1 Tax=Friedmanniomyces simplex TaxID=329884 RepID=A0A4U0X9P2_9PEZI|nr:hypothetical protein B0A55_07025 [Friedmanniomyces simplex]
MAVKVQILNSVPETRSLSIDLPLEADWMATERFKVTSWKRGSLESNHPPLERELDFMTSTHTRFGLAPNSERMGEQSVLEVVAKERGRPKCHAKERIKHRGATRERKVRLDAIKFDRSAEQGVRGRRDSDEHYVRFSDFNAPIEALRASMRLRELIAEAYEASGESDDAEASGTFRPRSVAFRNGDFKETNGLTTNEKEIDDMMAGLDIIDDDAPGAALEKQQRTEKPEANPLSFTALMRSLDGNSSEKAAKTETQTRSHNTSPIQRADGNATGATKHTEINLTSKPDPELKAEAMAKYLATFPGPALGYVEGSTNIYYHPGMSFEQAPVQLAMTIRSARGTSKSWAEQWSPRGFAEFARHERAVLNNVCRDLHWIAEFLHIGRCGWDCARWPRTLFAEMHGLLPELEGYLEVLAGYAGCEWLEEAAVVHVRYAFERLAELARR